MEGTFATGLTTIFDGITSAATWIWSIFGNVVTMIMNNPLIAYPVLLALAVGAIMLVVGIVRSFGMKGKTRGKGRRRKRA